MVTYFIMLICGLEKFSMVDFGDKISCTVFTGGCNLRCPFCHNGALVVGDVASQRIDEREALDYLKKRKGLVDAVCVTGGEATLQKDLDKFLATVKDMGYIVKLDSNGLRPDVLSSLLDRELVDYMAMDIKNSPAKYALTCGLDVDMTAINESVDLIKSRAKDYEFRTTVIKEFHSDEDMAEIADWLTGSKRYVLQHYKDSEGCISHGYTAYEKEEAQQLLRHFDGKVQYVGLRGFD